MKFIYKYVKPLYLTTYFFVVVASIALLFVMRFFYAWVGVTPYLAFSIFIGCIIIDYVLLFLSKSSIFALRKHADRLSNGDDNPIKIVVESTYPFKIDVEIIDEIPHQFQKRDVLFKADIEARGNVTVHYKLRPLKRGVYHFGVVNIYVGSPFNLLNKRYQQMQPSDVPVYPSYIQMRKFQLMAISNKLNEAGVKKIRRLGHSLEFVQIKEYVQGDDYRTLNWKATARKGQLMINNFTDEKSQQVYCIIDKGRVMKMPFDGLSLLDYAINASLVLTNVALLKQDKAGLITFNNKIGYFLQAARSANQMQTILSVLYNQKTRWLESDFEQLYIQVRRKISQRSLLVIYTNFESVSSMRRQLPYLKKIAQHHLLLIVFFENSGLKSLVEGAATTLEDVYIKTIAEKFSLEKKLIVKELQQHGIITLLTSPQQLTINALNKYLELKAKQMI